jgi:hypothetical protein
MRDKFGMKLIMSERAWYWHKEGATRWNEELADFKSSSKEIENINVGKFIDKWGFNPHQKQIWFSKELVS